MKNLLHKIASVFVVCAALAAFTACNDDDGKVKKPQVSSELVGSYTPHYFKEVPDEWGGEPSRLYLEVAAAWTDPDNIPGIDLSESMGMPAGSFVMPFNTILDLVSAIGSQFVSSGLVQLDLHSDGLFAAKYHDVVVEEGADIMMTIFSPTFAEAVSVFPSAETAAVLPEGALSFYTESNLFFAAISKDFIRAIEKQEGMEILSEIDKMLGAYKGLSVVSTDSHYAIPFKYTFEGGVFRLYVDRAMMLPYVKLLKDVLGGLGLDPSQMMGLDPAVILDDLFNATTELQIAVYLKKM